MAAGKSYESTVIVARAMRKSIDFSRRNPAQIPDSPPSFSRPARPAAGARPDRSAKRAISCSTSSLVASRCSRRATSSSTRAVATALRATSRWVPRDAAPAAQAALRVCPRVAPAVCPTAHAQRVERFDLPQVLRELAVELRQDAPLEPFY